VTKAEQIRFLIKILLEEMPEYRNEYAKDLKKGLNQRNVLRSLMNLRPPMPLKEEFLVVQDVLLQNEAIEKGIVTLEQITEKNEDGIYLWKGDITRLATDGIVNAANDELLGCFQPCHNCIDNVIHSAAGLQLRDACNKIMETQGREERVGNAKITSAYNLPCKYVIHTVGPNIRKELTKEDLANLKSCYRSCLETADKNQLSSLAFCCISTGEFHFPNELAAKIAIDTVKTYLEETKSKLKIVFNVFQDKDYQIYHKLLF